MPEHEKLLTDSGASPCAPSWICKTNFLQLKVAGKSPSLLKLKYAFFICIQVYRCKNSDRDYSALFYMYSMINLL